MIKFTEATKITIDQLPDEPLVHKLEEQRSTFSSKAVLAVVIVITAGILSGYLLASPFSKSKISPPSKDQSSATKAKMVVGSQDEKTFRDSAEGVLEANGTDGEGTHRLIRPGGESQTVYLTSSVLDLNQFIGKKVRVWGETFAAKKAGWLMDIGKVETLE